MHVPKGRAEVVEGSLAVTSAKALDGTLEAENPKVEKLDAMVIAHAIDPGLTASTGSYLSGAGPLGFLTSTTIPAAAMVLIATL